jgi:hypothetical protein
MISRALLILTGGVGVICLGGLIAYVIRNMGY